MSIPATDNKANTANKGYIACCADHYVSILSFTYVNYFTIANAESHLSFK